MNSVHQWSIDRAATREHCLLCCHGYSVVPNLLVWPCRYDALLSQQLYDEHEETPSCQQSTAALVFAGGELQRFAIAVVAAQAADIYMIDEPSSYLDVRQRLKAAQVRLSQDPWVSLASVSANIPV